ncbi:MAG: glycosyltransferase family 2 protein [Candidatus Omnitrophica bacterium]|nr:glycosyltransferase family 2 protein [Candidatus Omnitrophota bacterium]
MEGKIPLSIVILTKNESGRIRDCLGSVPWADEVLVVDDESADDTAAVAQSLGARVLRRRMDIEGRHRNWAAEQARHEWILSLDADERVTPELAEELRRLFRDGPQHGTYAIPRRNFIGARWVRHGGWYPSAQLKLFKRSVFRWEEASVHPRALSDASCGQLRHDLLHYSYRDLSDFVEKMNRQTTLEARKWVQDGRTVTLGKALRRAADRFFRSFISKRGYRDGVLGFVVAWFASAYQLLSYAKYVEATQAARAASPARAPAAARS